SAERALERAAELARSFGAKVVVVSVAAPEPAPAPVPGAFGLMPYDYSTPVAGPTGDAVRQEHRARVEAFFADEGVPAEFTGVSGIPTQELVEQAEQHGADLIVVGTREPGFVERLIGGGSVSQGVARHARCDVLIVHEHHA
ncbi:MAG: universal stress protein, partial [Gaiellaceae bacterium]